jgi:hypothetical protein
MARGGFWKGLTIFYRKVIMVCREDKRFRKDKGRISRMEPNQVVNGWDYKWNMAPRDDGSQRSPFIRVTSEVRFDENAYKDREGNFKGDDVVNAVFLQRDGAQVPTRRPIRVRFLNPVAYAQGLKRGDVVYWQRNDPELGEYYYVKITVDGPRDDSTGAVPIIWHHDKPSHDGKPAGDSKHDVPNRYLFRKEAVDVMRATRPSTPRGERTGSSPTQSRTAAAPTPTSGVDPVKFQKVLGYTAELLKDAGRDEDADDLLGTLGKGPAYEPPVHPKR